MSVHKHRQTTSQRQSNRWTEEDGERGQGRPNGPPSPLSSPDVAFFCRFFCFNSVSCRCIEAKVFVRWRRSGAHWGHGSFVALCLRNNNNNNNNEKAFV